MPVLPSSAAHRSTASGTSSGTSSPARRRGSSRPSGTGGKAGSPRFRETSRSSSPFRTEGPAGHDIAHPIDDAQRREDPHPDRDHDQSPHAAENHRRNGSEERRRDSGFEATELVGGADEKCAHR